MLGGPQIFGFRAGGEILKHPKVPMYFCYIVTKVPMDFCYIFEQTKNTI